MFSGEWNNRVLPLAVITNCYWNTVTQNKEVAGAEMKEAPRNKYQEGRSTTSKGSLVLGVKPVVQDLRLYFAHILVQFLVKGLDSHLVY